MLSDDRVDNTLLRDMTQRQGEKVVVSSLTMVEVGLRGVGQASK